MRQAGVADWNRTNVNDFADRCQSPWLPRHNSYQRYRTMPTKTDHVPKSSNLPSCHINSMSVFLLRLWCSEMESHHRSIKNCSTGSPRPLRVYHYIPIMTLFMTLNCRCWSGHRLTLSCTNSRSTHVR